MEIGSAEREKSLRQYELRWLHMMAASARPPLVLEPPKTHQSGRGHRRCYRCRAGDDQNSKAKNSGQNQKTLVKTKKPKPKKNKTKTKNSPVRLRPSSVQPVLSCRREMLQQKVPYRVNTLWVRVNILKSHTNSLMLRLEPFLSHQVWAEKLTF